MNENARVSLGGSLGKLKSSTLLFPCLSARLGLNGGGVVIWNCALNGMGKWLEECFAFFHALGNLAIQEEELSSTASEELNNLRCGDGLLPAWSSPTGPAPLLKYLSSGPLCQLFPRPTVGASMFLLIFPPFPEVMMCMGINPAPKARQLSPSSSSLFLFPLVSHALPTRSIVLLVLRGGSLSVFTSPIDNLPA